MKNPGREGALLSPLPTADEAHARRRSGGAAQPINPHGRPLPPANHTAGAAGAPLPHPAREASARTELMAAGGLCARLVRIQAESLGWSIGGMEGR